MQTVDIINEKLIYYSARCLYVLHYVNMAAMIRLVLQYDCNRKSQFGTDRRELVDFKITF